MTDFSAYVRLGPARYRERLGLDFEDFAVGQKFKHRPGLNITQQENEEEALDTINAAQLHYDANYAAHTEWKKNLVVSSLTLQRVVGMASKTYARRRSILSFDDISLTGPVYGGDTLYSESEVLAVEECRDKPGLGLVSVLLNGLKADGTGVVKICTRMLVYRRGFYPGDDGTDTSAESLKGEKFAAYRELTDGSLIEQVGIYYDDFIPGEVYEHRPGRTVFAAESIRHALRSLDISPQYHDLNFAGQAGDNLRLYEAFLVGAMITSSTRTLGRVVANLAWNDFRFIKEVRDGDTFYAESEILDKRESKHRPTQGIVNVVTSAKNQNNEMVCSCRRTLLIYKKGLGPYEAAGY